MALRRTSMKIAPVAPVGSVAPIAILRSSLVFNPVASESAHADASFADVLVAAIDTPQVGTRSPVYRNRTAAVPEVGKQKIDAPQPISLQQYKSSTDLYEQLDTLLREKSMLIAVV